MLFMQEKVSRSSCKSTVNPWTLQAAIFLFLQKLDDDTDLLAEFLQHIGVGPEKNVGIYMERSLEYTIAYIAILKAGKLVFIFEN